MYYPWFLHSIEPYITHDWTQLHIDNLFNYVKFTIVSYGKKSLVHTTFHRNWHYIAQDVLQKGVKLKLVQDRFCGTLRVEYLQEVLNYITQMVPSWWLLFHLFTICAALYLAEYY